MLPVDKPPPTTAPSSRSANAASNMVARREQAGAEFAWVFNGSKPLC